ncbi:MAG: NUDIX domain-containing protein [Phycisphaerae bacterium]
MHRDALLDRLRTFSPVESADGAARQRIVEFVRSNPDCFERSNSAGHITGSAWLIDPTGTRVLLTLHRKLGRWLQLGGHADGDCDAAAAALREAREESGIDAITLLDDAIFDLDVHEIPACDGVAAHLHYDIRFLMQVTGDPAFRTGPESRRLAWCTSDELSRLDPDASVGRMHRKWLARSPA